MPELPDHELYLVYAELTRQQASRETDPIIRQLLDDAAARYIALAAISKAKPR